jgi:hypothetical protein
MDPKYLNCRSEFALGDHVQVSYKWNTNTFSGTISYIEYALSNRGLKSGPYTDHIYVSMDDPQVYKYWLLRGSPIIVKRDSRKCVIREIYYDDQDRIKQVKVAVDDGSFMSYPAEFVIGPEEIGSMLIWRAGYNIVKGTKVLPRSLRLRVRSLLSNERVELL